MNSLKVVPRVFFTLLSTKSCFSDGRPGEKCILSRVGSFWDAVSSKCPDSDGCLCQAEMDKPLDNSSVVEQDAGVVALSVCSLARSLPPARIHAHTCETAQLLADPLGLDFCPVVCMLVRISVWGMVDTGQSLDKLGICRLIGLNAI